MQKTLQQQLANRLYELLPHKKELEFGCEILDRKDNIQKRIAGSNGEEKVLIKGIGEIEKYKLLDIYNFEIIGQPLRLDSIVEALLLLEISDKKLLKVMKLWQPNNMFENQKEELYTELGQLLL